MRRGRPGRGRGPGCGGRGHRPGGGRGAGRAGRGGRGRDRRGRPGGASATTWSARRRGWSCRPPTGSPCTPGWADYLRPAAGRGARAGRAPPARVAAGRGRGRGRSVGASGRPTAAMAPAGLGGRGCFLCAGAAGRPGPGRPTGAGGCCGLALARLRGFDLSGGSATLREAAAVARSAGDPALIGEVALVMEGYTDPGWVTLGKQLCDEALAGLPAGDSPLRARLLARRAAEATYHWEPEAGPLSGQALAMAERLGDPRALRSALRARQLARGGPDGALDRVELGSADAGPRASPTATTRRCCGGGCGGWTRSPSSAGLATASAELASLAPTVSAAAVARADLASAAQRAGAGVRARGVRPGPGAGRRSACGWRRTGTRTCAR